MSEFKGYISEGHWLRNAEVEMEAWKWVLEERSEVLESGATGTDLWGL